MLTATADAGAGDDACSVSQQQFNNNVQHYKFIRQLGCGSFGRVFEAEEKNCGIRVAIKVLSKQMLHKYNMTDRVWNEIHIHQKLQHPNVVKLLTHFEDSKNFYLVLELCHCCLQDEVNRIGKLSADRARHLLTQITLGLQYLHDNCIMHRDLTLSNILLTADDEVRIGDFGLAAVVTEDGHNDTLCGTPNYISPEVSTRSQQGTTTDLWSLGVLLYTMLVGYAPFDTKDPSTTMAKARQLNYELPDEISPTAADLIVNLLRHKPKERLSTDQILHHQFCKEDTSGTKLRNNFSHDSGNSSLTSKLSSNRQPISPPEEDHVTPLDTGRLQQCRIAKGGSILTITGDGGLTLEQVRAGHVTCLLQVSANGRQIKFVPQLACAAVLQDRPVEFSNQFVHHFEFPRMSRRCRRLYEFAGKFLQILRSRTPAVTLHSRFGKFVLFADATFLAQLHCGIVLQCASSAIASCSWRQQLDQLEDGKRLLRHVTRVQTQVMEIANTMDRLARGQDSCNELDEAEFLTNYFPVTIGKPLSV